VVCGVLFHTVLRKRFRLLNVVEQILSLCKKDLLSLSLSLSLFLSLSLSLSLSL
jgi:hypothetical protein